ncbi:MAG: hypothetical protein JJ992_11860 [Planctomycetes bacterium]|nr:hypothetical protein [Planctomycetota bacterium]
MADIIVGGRNIVGDMSDEYSIRHTGSAHAPVVPNTDIQRVDPPNREVADDRAGVAIRQESRGVLVGDVPASAASHGALPVAPKAVVGDTTVLPASQGFVAPPPEIPCVSIPDPAMPIAGSHYNLNPHSQMWSSPGAIQGARILDGRPYPTTRLGGTPPPQRLPNATRSTFEIPSSSTKTMGNGTAGG